MADPTRRELEAPMRHTLRLTPGHIDGNGKQEPPWQCVVCKKYFLRYRHTKTCKGRELEASK